MDYVTVVAVARMLRLKRKPKPKVNGKNHVGAPRDETLINREYLLFVVNLLTRSIYKKLCTSSVWKPILRLKYYCIFYFVSARVLVLFFACFSIVLSHSRVQSIPLKSILKIEATD